VESVFWASIFAIWVGFGPFAGAMALFIHTLAALGKLFSEQVEHIDPGPVEALTATGANLFQILRYAVVPQVIPQFLAFSLYRWDINLRMATVVALVGGGGIGQLLFEYKDDLQWNLVGGVIILFMITVWIMDYVSGWVREKIV
jgi:phosphonate transport system permease protein